MMDPQTRLGRNALWMILSRFGAQGLAVVFTILLARRLGSAVFGEYAFIVAVIFVANALTTFGTDMLLIREIASTGDFSRLPTALIIQLVLSSLFIAAVWAFSAWIPNQSPDAITALKIYSFALIPLAFFTVFTTALRGVQRMAAYTLLNIFLSMLQVGVVFILRKQNLVLLASLLLSIQTLTTLFAGLLCSFVMPHFWREFRLSSFPPLPQILSFLKKAAPIAWLALLGIIYQRLNIYLLSTMSGAMDTGIYSAALRAVEASKTAHLAIFAALYPAMAEGVSLRAPQERSNLFANKEIASSGFDAHVSTLLAMTYPKLLLAAATMISLILSLLAKQLVLLLYGNEFNESTGVLKILAWVLIPFTINTYLTLSFLASDRERLLGRTLTVSLLGLLLLNLWWIPAKGPTGSAWAALIAECLQSVLLLASARSFVDIQGEIHEFPNLP
jgi:O-antigen/teichoic acid export membrane protein